jgi:hypothetical protein
MMFYSLVCWVRNLFCNIILTGIEMCIEIYIGIYLCYFSFCLPCSVCSSLQLWLRVTGDVFAIDYVLAGLNRVNDVYLSVCIAVYSAAICWCGVGSMRVCYCFCFA